MNYFELLTMLLFLLAFISYLNEKIFKIPFAIAITATSVILSVLCILLEEIGLITIDYASINFLRYDFFSEFVLTYVLGFLLFAGALHVKLDELKEEGFLILVLSTIGVVIFTVLYGTIIYYLLHAFNIKIDYLISLLIGVILSPTDPIAVMSILNACYVPKKLRILISGESLFNDGISYSLFIIIAGLQFGGLEFSVVSIGEIVFQEIFVSLIIGLMIAYASMALIKTTEDPIVAILITFSTITLCFTLADRFQFSGPLSVVCIGLIYGQQISKTKFVKSGDKTYGDFWHVLDQIVNGLLFLLMGLELSTLEFTKEVFILSVIAIVLNLTIRFISVIFPTAIYHMKRKVLSSRIQLIILLTWGGLRGGLSLALIMSLGVFDHSKTIISVVYFVIIFSIIVQGLTIKPLMEKHNFESINEV